MSKEAILLKSLTKFYEDENNIKILKSLLNKDSGVSLRNIEWFVTNHSRKHKTSYTTQNGKQFVVHMAYKSSLDGYSKKLFDPFCRTQRIEFNDMTTTVAQLNFIKWCIENNIIDYVKDLKQKKSLPDRPQSGVDCIRNQTSAV
jgi:hypothetical protein